MTLHIPTFPMHIPTFPTWEVIHYEGLCPDLVTVLPNGLILRVRIYESFWKAVPDRWMQLLVGESMSTIKRLGSWQLPRDADPVAAAQTALEPFITLLILGLDPFASPSRIPIDLPRLE